MARATTFGAKQRFGGLPSFMGGVVVVAALTSLAGWIFGVDALKDWSGSGITIKANAIFAALGAGLAIILLPNPRHRLWVRVFAAVPLVLGALILSEHLFHVDFGIDTLFFHEPVGAVATTAPGRVGPPASTCCFLLGLGLLLASSGRRSLRRAAIVLGIVCCLVALLAVGGYAFNAHPLYGIATLTAISLQMAFFILLIGAGLVFAIRDEQPTSTLVEDSTAGQLARLSLPIVIVLPFGLAMLRTWGEARGFYDAGTGRALLVVSFIVFLCALLWAGARLVRSKEKDLAENSSRMAAILASITDAFIVIDSEWRYTHVNDALALRTKRPARDLIGKKVWDLFPDAVHTGAYRDLQRAMEERVSVEYELHFEPLGGWFLSKAYPTPDGGLAIYSRDISDRKQVEETLRKSDERTQLAIKATRMVTWEWEPPTGAIARSDSFSDVYGLPASATVDDAISHVLPEDQPEYLAKVQQIAESGGEFVAEFRIRRDDDGRVVWLEQRAKAMVDGSGKVSRVVGVTLDISQRKEAEEAIRKTAETLRNLNEELERRVEERTADLLEANEQLNGFTYSVAHDLRQSIRGIVVNSQMVLGDYGTAVDGEGREMLVRLAAAGKKMAALVDDLLKYARVSKLEPHRRKLDVTFMVQGIVDEIRARFPGSTIQVQSDMSAQADASLLRLVFENLLENACKYVPPGEEPSVSVGCRDGVFFVADQGIGFDPAYATRIFDPFERLEVRGSYEGTGIGLANVRRAVLKHGGRIWNKSALGQGATFYFTLEPSGHETAVTGEIAEPNISVAE